MSPRKRNRDLGTWTEAELLATPLRDLPLQVEHCESLRAGIPQVQEELRARGLRFRPYYWLSDEWFTPDGFSGIAIPFFLAHPRLTALEVRILGEAEGSEPEEGLRILRHEVGHALQNAFQLQNHPLVREAFGPSQTPYPRAYAPRPYSRRFVRNLGHGYAQSHPDEDFAETFAVWLDPHSRWRTRYKGWGALRKLKAMDEILRDLRGKRPLKTTRRAVDPLTSLDETLGEHYARRKRIYHIHSPRLLDRQLLRVFGPEGAVTAAPFLRRIRKGIGHRVGDSLGTPRYHVDAVYEDVLKRVEALGLSLKLSPQETRRRFSNMLASEIKAYLASGRHRVIL